MITEIKGYVKASRKAFTKVTALIVALAIMCAVTAFAASPSFYVDIYDGNEITRVLTSKSDPKTIVSQAGVKLDDRDKLDSTGFTAGEDSALRIYRSATVSFTDIEGNTIYTVFAGTVQDLLEELDVTLSDGQLITYPLDTVLKDGMDVRVTNSYDVSVTADGTTNSFTMGEGTVRDALNRIGVTLGDDDEVSPELDSEVCEGTAITVYRVSYSYRTVTETVEFTKKTEKSAELYTDQQVISQKGVNGSKKVTYCDKTVDGKYASSEAVTTVVL